MARRQPRMDAGMSGERLAAELEYRPRPETAPDLQPRDELMRRKPRAREERLPSYAVCRATALGTR